MNIFEVLEITETVVKQCNDREDKFMCCYCPHKKFCEYLEKQEKKER